MDQPCQALQIYKGGTSWGVAQQQCTHICLHTITDAVGHGGAIPADCCEGVFQMVLWDNDEMLFHIMPIFKSLNCWSQGSIYEGRPWKKEWPGAWSWTPGSGCGHHQWCGTRLCLTPVKGGCTFKGTMGLKRLEKGHNEPVRASPHRKWHEGNWIFIHSYVMLAFQYLGGLARSSIFP